MGGGKISSKESYIYKRSEYTSAGGGGGAFRAPRKHFEFRTPQSESERIKSDKLFHIFFDTFLLRIFWKIFFYDYRSKIAQLDLDIYTRLDIYTNNESIKVARIFVCGIINEVRRRREGIEGGGAAVGTG